MLPSEPWLEPYVPIGHLAMDVGANIGDFTAHLVQSFDEVIAFEPNPDAAKAFRVRHNGRVDLIENAVGETVGTLDLNVYGMTAHTSAVVYEDHALNVFGRGTPTGTLRVPMVSIDSLGLEPDFIKVDTEGFEREVLLGARQTLEHIKPILLVEIHAVPHGEWCTEFLQGLDYETERIGHPSSLAGENNYWLAAR